MEREVDRATTGTGEADGYMNGTLVVGSLREHLEECLTVAPALVVTKFRGKQTYLKIKTVNHNLHEIDPTQPEWCAGIIVEDFEDFEDL